MGRAIERIARGSEEIGGALGPAIAILADAMKLLIDTIAEGISQQFLDVTNSDVLKMWKEWIREDWWLYDPEDQFMEAERCPRMICGHRNHCYECGRGLYTFGDATHILYQADPPGVIWTCEDEKWYVLG